MGLEIRREPAGQGEQLPGSQNPDFLSRARSLLIVVQAELTPILVGALTLKIKA